LHPFIEPILAACHRYGVPLIEDAAEALGATYQGRSPGVFGQAGIFSFNGNWYGTQMNTGCARRSKERIGRR